MESVNNFITDLLDSMGENTFGDLIIEGGKAPYCDAGGEHFELSGYEPVLAEEISADMESLGLFIEDKWNVLWFHESDVIENPLVRYNILVSITDGNPTVRFHRFTGQRKVSA